MSYLITALQLIFVPAISPLVIGLIRLIKARLQGRQGAVIWQPYRNLWKLFHKEEVISSDASWVFSIAPFIVFATTAVLGAAIPIVTTQAALPALSDFLIIAYLVALGVFFLAIAGLDVGSGFGGLGASREMTLAALNEGGLLFSLLTVALIAKTTSLSSMIENVVVSSPSTLIPLVLAGIAFLIALLAENARYPFDNPATHLELTMVHEAMILEYSGKRLALIEWASANKLAAFMIMGANLFIPWGVPATTTSGGILLGIALVVIKVAVIAALVAIIESSMAKLRFFRLPDLLFTAFLLAAIAISIITF
jgi:formate hydrogenlyase subunit 4